jgi:hypothetical protein
MARSVAAIFGPRFMSSRDRKTRRIVVLCAISILFAAVGAIEFWPHEQGIVSITSPLEGDSVTYSVAINGIVNHLGKDTHIAVATVCDSWYYIHFDQDISISGAHWHTSSVLIGSERDRGKPCSILALIATDAARHRLLDYLRNPLRAPLCSLPEGLTVAHKVTIHRNSNDPPRTDTPLNPVFQCQLAPPEESGMPVSTLVAITAAAASSLSASMALLTYLTIRRKREARIYLPKEDR